MKRRGRGILLVLAACALLLQPLPGEALCWGSLYVISKSTNLRNRCPYPVLTSTWRIQCYDGCGYSDGAYSRSLSGYGECFKGDSCRDGVRCLPVAGRDIRRISPPSLSSSMVNRQGYYALAPCQLPGCRNESVSTMTVFCNCDSEYSPAFCAQNDPLIVSLGDSRYQLTDRDGGVDFDLGANGTVAPVPWTEADTDEAFLVLDRNRNGWIDDGSELFGDVTPQHASEEANGFLALALFDDVLSGGNEDGRISSADAVFPRLQLWRDTNHNGISEASELLSLEAAGLEWISLDYQSSARVDRFGNEFRFRAASGWSQGQTRMVWSVFLLAR